jgi:hypothetical protein
MWLGVILGSNRKKLTNFEYGIRGYGIENTHSMLTRNRDKSISLLLKAFLRGYNRYASQQGAPCRQTAWLMDLS